jgi:hypothetical protein
MASRVGEIWIVGRPLLQTLEQCYALCLEQCYALCLEQCYALCLMVSIGARLYWGNESAKV